MRPRLFIGLSVALLAVRAPAAPPAPSAGALAAQIDTVEALASAQAPGPHHANAMTALRRARFVLDHYRPDEAVRAFTTHEIRQAAYWARQPAVRTPTNAPLGLRIEGYHSDNDDSYQPFVRYLPSSATGSEPLPLLVYLHGYFDMNIVNWTPLPTGLVAVAESGGYAVVAPFARGNTDFQGIGEQDVLRVIDEMQARYHIDLDRIILAGFSMGGMGAYTIAGHHPRRFAGALVASGRGDYYFWHGVKRDELPAYRRALVDADFASALIPRIATLPLFVAHGGLDFTVSPREGRHIARALKAGGADLRYIEIPTEGHYVFDPILARKDVQRWLAGLRRDAARAIPPLTPRPVAMKDAFLGPFVFVDAFPAEAEGRPRRDDAFTTALRDWQAYAQADPRRMQAADIPQAALVDHHVFLFAPADTDSPLVATALAGSPVTVDGRRFLVGEASYPSAGNGMIVVRQSPWHPNRLVVVALGESWGAGVPPNHKFDFVPGYIVFSGDQRDWDGANKALRAGFFGPNGAILPAFDHVAEPAPSRIPE